MEKEFEYTEEEQRSSFSLKDIFKAIFSFKWWIIGATALATVLSFVVFTYVLNPLKKVLSASYTYSLAGTPEREGSTTYRLVDGSLFDCYDITSKENLQTIKDKYYEYRNVDINKIYDSNAIKVSRVIKENINGEIINQNEMTFTLSCNTSYFPTDEIGQSFLFDLISSPTKISDKAISNYTLTSFIDGDFKNETYEKQINLLEKQFLAIDSTYKSIEREFGETAVVGSSGTKLQELYNSFLSEYTDGKVNDISLLLSEMYTNYYYKYERDAEEETIADLKVKGESYIKLLELSQSEKKNYENAVSKLIESKTINPTDSSYSSTIVEYTENIIELDKTIQTLEERLAFIGYEKDGDGKYVLTTGDCLIKRLETKDPKWVVDNEEFGKKILGTEEIPGFLQKLQEDKEVATSAFKGLYSQSRNKVTFIDGAYVSVSGGTSLRKVLILGFAAGFLLSTAVVTVVYIVKKKPKQN